MYIINNINEKMYFLVEVEIFKKLHIITLITYCKLFNILVYIFPFLFFLLALFQSFI